MLFQGGNKYRYQYLHSASPNSVYNITQQDDKIIIGNNENNFTLDENTNITFTDEIKDMEMHCSSEEVINFKDVNDDDYRITLQFVPVISFYAFNCIILSLVLWFSRACINL